MASFNQYKLFSETMLLSKQGEENREDNTDDNACGNGKVETKPLLFYHYIARKPSNEWDFIAQHKTYPRYDKDNAENYEHFPYCRHYASL